MILYLQHNLFQMNSSTLETSSFLDNELLDIDRVETPREFGIAIR